MVSQPAAQRNYIRYNSVVFSDSETAAGMAQYPTQLDDSARRQVAAWLMLCCAMIFAMVVLGGATRLTGSGLSMIEWDPIFGVVPPLNQEEWEDVFSKYR